MANCRYIGVCCVAVRVWSNMTFERYYNTIFSLFCVCGFAALSDPIDVYSDWIDECERINGGAEA